MATFLKRKEVGDAAKTAIEAASVESTDSVFAKKYPATTEFLSLEEWEPGQARTRGTITVFWEEGTFKAALNDRDGEEVAFVSKTTFTGLLDAIEKGFIKGDHDWRSTRQKKPSWKRRG